MKIITIQCNKCGTKSIYVADSPESKELKCKGCKSVDVKIIKNPGEQPAKKKLKVPNIICSGITASAANKTDYWDKACHHRRVLCILVFLNDSS